MKITLIYLPNPYLKNPSAQIPLGILYIKSILNNSYIDVICDVKNYSSFTNEEAILDLPYADIYGITVTSLDLPIANEFSKLIKRKYPDCKIIIGGAGIDQYLSFVDYVDYSYVDSCIIGEGENITLKIVDDFRCNKQLHLSYRSIPFGDINYIPFPDRKCISNKGGDIFAYGKNYKGNESTTILTSRGCNFSCAFCASPKYTKKVRYRTPENVFQEVKEVIRDFNIYQFRFSDDNFTSRPYKDLKKLCDYLKQLDIVWRVSIRVKPFNNKIAKLLKDSGCVEVSFGIESFDDAVLEGLNKKTDAEDNVKALKIASDAGLNTRVLFMIRTPYQTRKTIDINIEYLNKIDYTIIACTSFVPLPGSDIWINPDKYNIEILSRDLSKYNFYFYGKEGENELFDVIKIKNRTLEDLNKETIFFRNYLKATGKLNTG
jgi:anaerobic magnesium-protoporphyrin IX monomethyl ester cyclase